MTQRTGPFESTSRTPHTGGAGRRIVVVGTTGSGKTTVAAELAKRLHAPHVELDALHWGPAWTEVPDDVFRERTLEAIARDSWVADGNYHQIRDILWPRADAILWLDYSFPVVFRQARGAYHPAVPHRRDSLERQPGAPVDPALHPRLPLPLAVQDLLAAATGIPGAVPPAAARPPGSRAPLIPKTDQGLAGRWRDGHAAEG